MCDHKRPSVLVVDDVPANIRILAEILRDDHDIHVATRGGDVLDLARRLVPDIILLDVVMPDMDGYAVCRRLKADAVTRDIPIIFVTARHAPEDEALGLSLGAVDYIVKPASPAVVRARVKNHLELRAARLELARQNVALTEAAKLREDVDHIMRHDLKAPLTGIIGLPRILLDEGGLTETQAKLLSLVEESGLKMLSMINRSLDLFKMERGTYILCPAPVELTHLIRRLFVELTSLAAQFRVTFSLAIDGRPVDETTSVEVSGERLLLHTMLSNCLKNAVEASPEAGEVSVDLLSAADQVVIRLHNRGTVPAAIRETFFCKFATAGKSDGTGLGAYSSKRIAEVHGGTIAMATSDATDSTTITIDLPRSPEAGRRTTRI
jgi:two-component system, sensor histidine kinase and response regulator